MMLVFVLLHILTLSLVTGAFYRARDYKQEAVPNVAIYIAIALALLFQLASLLYPGLNFVFILLATACSASPFFMKWERVVTTSPAPTPPPINHYDAIKADIALHCPKPQPIIKELIDHLAPKLAAATTSTGFGQALAYFEKILPLAPLMTRNENGTPIALYRELAEDDPPVMRSVPRVLSPFMEDINNFKVTIQPPQAMRFEHHHIIARSGHGKTQCIQEMLLKDMATDASLIVIDSQNDLIKNLLKVVPLERTVLIDPNDEKFVPALNLFGDDRSTDMFRYIFSALDATMTSKQSTLYEHMFRLLRKVPGATIRDMSKMLNLNGTLAYQQYINLLDQDDQDFFQRLNDKVANQYKETCFEVQRRLDTLRSNKVFAHIFSAPESRFNLSTALDAGKIVLINTAEERLGKMGSSVFGRYWIAAIEETIALRKSKTTRRPCFVYIDEAADYLGNEGDAEHIARLFRQARKYNVGLIVAHQMLSDLPQRVQATLHTNTAIKYAANLSAEDATSMAKQMRVKREFIDAQKKHGNAASSFAAMFGNVGTGVKTVKFFQLEKLPANPRDEVSAFIDRMRRDYYQPLADESEPKPKPPNNPNDVEETGTWDQE